MVFFIHVPNGQELVEWSSFTNILLCVCTFSILCIDLISNFDLVKVFDSCLVESHLLQFYNDKIFSALFKCFDFHWCMCGVHVHVCMTYLFYSTFKYIWNIIFRLITDIFVSTFKFQKNSVLLVLRFQCVCDHKHYGKVF